MKFHRRHFLAGLVSLGATIALPVAAAKATAAQINYAWDALLDDPWLFEVDVSGTIVAACFKEPTRRHDVFDADLSARCTVESQIDDIDACWPLHSHFEGLAANELAEVQSRLDESDELTLAERRRLKRLSGVSIFAKANIHAGPEIIFDPPRAVRP